MHWSLVSKNHKFKTELSLFLLFIVNIIYFIQNSRHGQKKPDQHLWVLLMGLSEWPEEQPLLFALFLGRSLVTVLENLLIILAIGSDMHFHTPRHIFLVNLSFSDIGFISTIILKMLDNIGSGSKLTSYDGLTQLYFFGLFADLDNFILAVMALDCYVAISHPLHYAMPVNSQCCILLVAGSWVVTTLHALVHALLMTRLSFCGPDIIPHYTVIWSPSRSWPSPDLRQ